MLSAEEWFTTVFDVYHDADTASENSADEILENFFGAQKNKCIKNQCRVSDDEIAFLSQDFDKSVDEISAVLEELDKVIYSTVCPATPLDCMVEPVYRSDEETEIASSMSLLELSPGKRMREKTSGSADIYAMSPGKRLRAKSCSGND